MVQSWLEWLEDTVLNNIRSYKSPRMAMVHMYKSGV